MTYSNDDDDDDRDGGGGDGDYKQPYCALHTYYGKL